jgi:hypothetical protein
VSRRLEVVQRGPALIVIRQQVKERPQAGGAPLFHDMPREMKRDA